MISFLLIMNVFTIAVFGFDKWQAKKHRWRISENILLGISLLGGIIGAAAGMIFFNHKVSKKSFVMKFILVVLIDLFLFYRVLRR
ncbi:DUF1294 domain-containing protein [Chryseobacterium culicis]|uniref:Uncharacterized membrane protein YsdA, DUF1294 family n=1 Tax=Chryseobacterium culicis TaxID=680127 RepID=A0A1H6HCM8_CHRCI|nr:DUF1294 domain-containing protein [Chryseobacterium culicis]SEH33541.1 Uncharacterized membrane protein YsdA, DUF1294 family [Chryseobacterium culicis]